MKLRGEHGEKTGKWTRRDLNPRPLRCERNEGLPRGEEIEIGERIGENFSDLAELIQQYVRDDADRFKKYLSGTNQFQRGLSSDRAGAYYNALLRLPDIPEPQALIDLNLKEYQVSAVKAFLDYLGTYTKVRSIAGYSFTEWKAFLVPPKREKPGKAPAVTTEMITAAYVATPDDLKTFFKFVMYTGLRCEHAHKLFQMQEKVKDGYRFSPKAIQTLPEIPEAVYIDSSPAAAKRKKFTEIAMFPASFGEELLNYTFPGYVPDTLLKKLRTAGEQIRPLFPELQPFTGKSLRKYHAQLLLNNQMDTLLIDYLQGRQPRTSAVLIQNYASPEKAAGRQYVERVLKAPATFPDLKAPAAPLQLIRTQPPGPALVKIPTKAPTKKVSGLAGIWQHTADQWQQTIPRSDTGGPDTRSHQYNNYTAVKTFLTDPNTVTITTPAELREAILRTEKPAYKNRLKGLRAWIRFLPEGPLGYPADKWITALSKIS